MKDWAGEIFVVDSGSTDRTVEITRGYTDKIVVHEFVNYAQQRNWAQQTLPFSYEWVFHLDADEQVSPELAASLQQAFAGNLSQVDGFLINRRAIFMGRWIKHGGLYPTHPQRLYRRAKGYCEEREYDQPYRVEGRVVKLAGNLLDDITTDLRRWTLSHERWAGQEVAEYFKQQQALAPRLFGSPLERRRSATGQALTALFARHDYRLSTANDLAAGAIKAATFNTLAFPEENNP